MATDLSEGLEGGHDAVYVYCCTPCADDKLNAEASFYCRNCWKLYCDSCIQHHDKILKDHQILGRKDVGRWGKVKAVTPAMMCEKHPDKEEEVYCADHELVCCQLCISTQHRACKQVNHLSEVAKGIQQTSEFQSFLTKAASLKTNLRNHINKRASNSKRLQTTSNEITSSFKTLRKNFDQFMDNLEKDSTAKLDSHLSILQNKIRLDTDTCSGFECMIQKFLDDTNQKCDESVFRCYSQCKYQLSRAEEMLSSMEDEDYQLTFTPDDRIQQFRSFMQTFGAFDITPKYLAPDYVYTVHQIQSHVVRTEKDTGKCSINAMYHLPDGQVVAIDHSNQKVKLLSPTEYSVTSELDMPPFPSDTCATTGKEMVVTVSSCSGNIPLRNELHFISVADGHLTHKSIVQLDHQCFTTAYDDGKLYVGSSREVFEYSLSGQKLKKIYEDFSRQGTTVCKFAFSGYGNRFYVTNFQQSLLVTADKSGQQLSALIDPELQKPTGVTVAGNGTVFVSGKNSHTVIQVDSEGRKKMTTLAKQSDGVLVPMSLCYDGKSNKLLIGQKKDDILVLQLK